MFSSYKNARLAAADQQLFAHAAEFFRELTSITDLGYERCQRNPLPTQWWWFLDVLNELPEIDATQPDKVLALA